MARRLDTLWIPDAHTLAKHAILRRYLQAWLPIMSRWNRRGVVIDGFAGPGRYASGEDGLPFVALKAALEHSHPIDAELFPTGHHGPFLLMSRSQSGRFCSS